MRSVLIIVVVRSSTQRQGTAGREELYVGVGNIVIEMTLLVNTGGVIQAS